MREIHTLTGLRGIAALIVFISHAANKGMLTSYFGRSYGQIGVMLFFVLSGFLMAHLYVRTSFEPSHVRRYALARAGRVLPLYLAVVVISIIISNYFIEGYVFDLSDRKEALMTLFLIKGKYILWTIPVEIHFYCIFVVFWYLYQRGTHPLLLTAFAIASVLPSVIFYLATGEVVKSVISSYAFAFFIGVVTAFYFEEFRRNEKLSKFADYAGLPFLVLLFINLPELRQRLDLVFSEGRYFRTWGDPINWLIIYGVFFCALFNSRSLAILNLRPFVLLGEVSYGLYLIHLPIVVYCTAYISPSYVAFVTALLLSVALSFLSLRYFERPLAARIRKL